MKKNLNNCIKKERDFKVGNNMKKLAVILMSCLCFASMGVHAAPKKESEKTKVSKTKVAKAADTSTKTKQSTRVKATVSSKGTVVTSRPNVKAGKTAVAKNSEKNLGKSRQRQRAIAAASDDEMSHDLKYVIFEYGTGNVLESKNADKVWPVASLTKVMTAHVFLKNHKDIGNCTQTISSADSDTIKFTRTRLKKEVEYQCEELLEAMLTVSDNYAASALARAIPGWSKQDFVNEMNMQAKRWGLKNTHFVDSSGLSPLNVSSASDYSRLAMYASHTPFLTDLATIQTKMVETVDGHQTQINNTNPLVRSGVKTVISKTGYIKESGYNLAYVSDSCDRQIGLVELGARSKGERNSFASQILRKYDCR